MNPKSSHANVVQFLTNAINASGKSLDVLAREAGWDNPRELELVLEGRIKLAAGLVPTVAKCLDVDEAELVEVMGEDYFPTFWHIAGGAFKGFRTLSRSERKLIRAWRTVVGDKLRDPQIVFVPGGVAVIVER